MKTALLVMVHGSPRPVANGDMFRVVEEVKARSVFDVVEAGFMECNAPTIPEAVDACVAQGADRVVAVPYFLHTGTHVADDLPTLLEEARERHPQVEFQMGRYIGTSPLLTDILAARAQAALGS
jgi:sirohydrochlorin ferrochelatase